MYLSNPAVAYIILSDPLEPAKRLRESDHELKQLDFSIVVMWLIDNVQLTRSQQVTETNIWNGVFNNKLTRKKLPCTLLIGCKNLLPVYLPPQKLKTSSLLFAIDLLVTLVHSCSIMDTIVAMDNDRFSSSTSLFIFINKRLICRV